MKKCIFVLGGTLQNIVKKSISKERFEIIKQKAFTCRGLPEKY